MVISEIVLAQVLASVRMVTWFTIMPPFSSRAVPPTVRVMLALALSFAAAPILSTQQLPTTGGALIGTVLVQVAIGAALGFVTMLLFQAVAAAGSLIDLFGGFSVAQVFDPMTQSMNTVFGQFHQMLAGVLLFVTGAHLIVIGGLVRTFEVLPIGENPNLVASHSVIETAFGVFFVTAVQVALPMIAVLFIADLGLALLTKVAPQLNAINVMFPAKIGLTLLLVGLTFPGLSPLMERLTDLALEAMSAIATGG